MKQVYIPFLLLLLAIIPVRISYGSTALQVDNMPAENIHIHTDKDIYFAGDMIFFRLYLKTGEEERPAHSSRVAYLSVNSRNGQTLAKHEVLINNRKAYGGIMLADTLRTGIFSLSAWTSKMLIDGTPPFRKQIVAINRFDAGTAGFISENRPGPGILSPPAAQGMRTEFTPAENGTFAVTLYSAYEDMPYIKMEKRNGNIVLTTGRAVQDTEEREITIARGGTILWKGKITEKDEAATFKINPADLGYGPLTLKVTDDRGNSPIEACWLNLIPETPYVDIFTDKVTYGQRERVRLTFRIQEGRARGASASVSVVKTESLLHNRPDIIQSLLPIIDGCCDNASCNKFILQSAGFIPAELMPVANEIFPERQPEIMIVPELREPVISGRVTTTGDNEPVAGATVFLSAADTIVNLQYSKTRQDGSFYFQLNDYYRDKNSYVNLFMSEEEAGRYMITLREKFVPLPFTPKSLVPDKNIGNHIEEASTVRRVMQAYNIRPYIKTAARPEHEHYSVPFLYRVPTHRINTADYVPLDNMAEIANEILPDLRIRGRGDNISPVVICSRTRSYMPGPPLFFMNGVYVRSFADIADMSSEEIVSVEILSVPWSFGSLRLNGIVGLFDNKGRDGIPADRLRTEIETSPEKEGIAFRKIEYNGNRQDNPGMPDLRETLLWDPAAVVNDGTPEDIVFYTGDLKGSYTIMVEGVTADGSPFSNRIEISVN